MNHGGSGRYCPCRAALAHPGPGYSRLISVSDWTCFRFLKTSCLISSEMAAARAPDLGGQLTVFSRVVDLVFSSPLSTGSRVGESRDPV